MDVLLPQYKASFDLALTHDSDLNAVVKLLDGALACEREKHIWGPGAAAGAGLTLQSLAASSLSLQGAAAGEGTDASGVPVPITNVTVSCSSIVSTPIIATSTPPPSAASLALPASLRPYTDSVHPQADVPSTGISPSSAAAAAAESAPPSPVAAAITVAASS